PPAPTDPASKPPATTDPASNPTVDEVSPNADPDGTVIDPNLTTSLNAQQKPENGGILSPPWLLPVLGAGALLSIGVLLLVVRGRRS
ncbi:MAG: hypothetical protein JOZ31_17040, partial [Verrucomicrobia bacterium]|nr:hypothetical protein [Verrucomicrobiota bacterium]